MYKKKITKRFALVALLFLCGGSAFGQSDPSIPPDCGEYQWPMVQEPCPEVQIKQKHDHTPQLKYRLEGWDTVVDCRTREGIVLSCAPYIPVQFFNGTYLVDQIPYNPPDTTFCFTLGAALANMNDPNRKKMPISTDDDFAGSVTNIPYPFYFFGIRKNAFVIGANGLVTFNTAAASSGCPWSYSASIPWPDGTSGAPSPTAIMRDAIYGVYEDTYPSPSIHTSGNPNWGIYYGVIDDYPCRKIICSWNDVPQFSCTSLRCTYQIVCYEGSNIVEVHVKQRQVCTSWNNGGKGLIGIQNATGQPQVKSSDPDAPNYFVQNGSPAAFYPADRNTFTTSVNNVAYRFTPQGTTNKRSVWYRIFDDGRDSIVLPEYDPINNPDAMNDTNGYVIPMDPYSDCPTLTKAIVKPTEPSKYVYHLRFMNANKDWYYLYDTIFVGIDTLNYIDIHKQPITDTLPSTLDVCIHDTAQMRIDIHRLEDIYYEEWNFYRISGGDTIHLSTLTNDSLQPGSSPSSNYLNVGWQREIDIFRLQFGDTIVLDTTLFTKEDYHTMGKTLKVRDISIYTDQLPTDGLRENKIDSIYIVVTADFTTSCHNYDTMLLRIFPIFDTTVEAGICLGQTYTWDTNGHAYKHYTENTDPETEWVRLHSTPGCDSVVHLKLKVFDVSYTVDHQDDCRPYTWINGKTYYQTNTATAYKDTIVLKNRYDCDSVVQLDFTLHPLTARLRSNVDHFDLDHLDAVLTDISTNGNGRVWKFPSSPDQTEATAYYSIPVDLDGAEILLIESSEYGCLDTASIYLPLNKEHFWVPNIFTPDNPAGNNTFGSVSTKTLNQEMLIYNRRGELVFHCEGVDCAWDGRDLNGDPCIQGAYVYVIRYTNEFEPKKTRVIRGTVTLLR